MTMTKKQREAIIKELNVSYGMELETVINYLTISNFLDGFKAKHIKDSLSADVQEELGHAQQLASRIRVLEGTPTGSLGLKFNQKSLQPPSSPLDIVSVIKGVIQAEEGAIKQYQTIIEMTDGVDPVTQDMCIALKGDEEEHRRLFVGFLAEWNHEHK